MEKTDRSGVWFFRGAFQGMDLFSSLAVSGDWVKKGIVPHSVVGLRGFLVLVLISVRAWPSYRATHGKVVLGAFVFVEDYRTPDEALVCCGGCADCCESELLSGRKFAG